MDLKLDPQRDLSKMDLNHYLRRVGITEFTAASIQPSLSTLRTLHHHHVHSVPFENLSVHSGEKILLDICWIFDKIVLRKRGGFCFENNSLFFWVLQQVGFQARMLSGRVRDPVTGVYGPPFDHMLLVVELEGRRWLCDVGFGEMITEPIPLEAGWEEEQDSGVYRLRVDGEEWFIERKDEEAWRSLYKFTLEERSSEEYREMCEFHQTDPSSFFLIRSLCTLQLPRARLTYMGHRLTSTEYMKGGGSVKTTRELSDEEIPGLLRDKFGIVLNRTLIPKDG
ncbi:hypothetical protein GDO81_023110 [Engystomops pustulosus]|uniref:arylamine N-acetyltransferase n=1 Tax=Engystomops pustulosus TaxID=76066 RepID=A0AAV6Z9T7_ENGPU|nr:hypothetical protein GDO81_023110 [Engystomops pustulosus]